jgi:hypothetical protein
LSELTTVPSTMFLAACKLIYVFVVILFISIQLYWVSWLMCLFINCVSSIVYKSPQLVPTLSQINLVYTLMAYLFKAHFKFVILSKPRCHRVFFIVTKFFILDSKTWKFWETLRLEICKLCKFFNIRCPHVLVTFTVAINNIFPSK